ncbi:hypothetical protein Pmani_006664 [Petrolisthes manimaculis]|uniref:Uncharacterized protein n=1 Tax=Petrolisthes manimaculis TaxID=1843537 RepID=A0AAE1Q960_9EUCA|nr:hypothetical protein Pmani_006664 [Petrolisthes manimaculis]
MARLKEMEEMARDLGYLQSSPIVLVRGYEWCDVVLLCTLVFYVDRTRVGLDGPLLFPALHKRTQTNLHTSQVSLATCGRFPCPLTLHCCEKELLMAGGVKNLCRPFIHLQNTKLSSTG